MVGRILRPGSDKDILAARFEVEKTETFHFKNLYEWMHDYLEENDWEDPDPIGGDKFEHYYWEKRGQDGAREQRCWWRVVKYPIKSEYFRFVMIIHFRNLKARPIEVVHKGQKVETWRGNLTMLFEAWLQLDYQNNWETHWLLKNFDTLYRNRIWKKQLDKWKDELWREAYGLGGWVKQYLEMKVPFDQPEMFHPIGGVGSPIDPDRDRAARRFREPREE